jgi:Cu/Ag efflux protein CusF
MRRSSMLAVFGLLIGAATALAFEVQGTIKKIDPDTGVVVAITGQDRTVRVPKDVKVLDAAGKPLADGLKAKELKEGAAVTLTVERENDKPVIRALRLTGKVAAPVQPAAPAVEKKVDTSALMPLTDLGRREYHGFMGGLYPDGTNERPAAHEAAGLALTKSIRPLDPEGQPNPDGKIVLLGIGFSNTVQVYAGFMQVAKDDKAIDPHIVLVNGAVGGMSANMIQDPDRGRGQQYWATVDEKLKTAGVTRAQVQAVWLKETNPGPHEGGFPKYAQTLQAELTKIVQIIRERFPNVKAVYVSSRSYAGWAKAAPGKAAPGNSEPYSYETGFALKWLIEQQIKSDPALNFDPARGPVKAPWLSWGPYLWANGESPRSDGFSYRPTDFTDRDRMHHGPDGMKKTGTLLLNFFKTDTTTRDWFVKKPT